MVIQLKIVPAKKCPKRDIISALDIYCKAVDPGSLTDTNQISDYIWNAKDHQTEPRQMFFYLLYDSAGTVEGFSELAYLPENQVLVLDYLCTRRRNHVLFYNFYHMVIQEIEGLLQRKGHYIRFILTELSLTHVNGQLIDIDSNYFRHLLSNENYRLLKYPYYQPPLLPQVEIKEFNLAITMTGMPADSALILSRKQYLSIVKELYRSHYLAWYKNDLHFENVIETLLSRIEREIIQNKDTDPITLVQCRLFDEGQCPKITAENITLQRQRKKKWRIIVPLFLWGGLAILTFLFCAIPRFSDFVAASCSFLTILAGMISIISLRNDFFGT